MAEKQLSPKRQRIAELTRAGASRSVIARELGLSIYVIERAQREAGLLPTRQWKRDALDAE